MANERNQEQRQKNDEQKLRHARSRNGYAGKAQNSGDQCDHQKYQRPVKHDASFEFFMLTKQ